MTVVNLNAAALSPLVKELDFLHSYERAEFKWHLEEHNMDIVLTEWQSHGSISHPIGMDKDTMGTYNKNKQAQLMLQLTLQVKTSS